MRVRLDRFLTLLGVAAIAVGYLAAFGAASTATAEVARVLSSNAAKADMVAP